MDEEPWRGWDNAEIYDRFVRERDIYDWLNARLVELTDVATARRVLDLGCGTGATTLACLRVLPPDAEVVGVDGSPEMVEVARANVLDPRAGFVVSAAAQLGDAVEGLFDRALSNAAFWQFPDPEAVFAGLARHLEPGARFVFNVPSERVVGRKGSVHPFQVALARAIEAGTGQRLSPHPASVDPQRLSRQAAAHGMSLTRVERRTYTGTQDELMELMTIPAMIGPLTGGLDARAREKVLAAARAHVDPDERVEVPWSFFIFRRADGAV